MRTGPSTRSFKSYVFQDNYVMRNFPSLCIQQSTRDEVTGGWRKFYNKEIHTHIMFLDIIHRLVLV
jgi:hypothetical protein